MKIKQTMFLVSKCDGHFNVYDYFIPTRAFRFEEDAEKFIEEQNSDDWEIDMVILE